ncbi:hypothetical protein ACTWQF_31985 [Streptomyces sp. 8N114]|uniref:hypothetical protein n=1 Tax=Streptomyces sp. 8N114 TaxID=3457419 RepID=UPI003FD25966
MARVSRGFRAVAGTVAAVPAAVLAAVVVGVSVNGPAGGAHSGRDGSEPSESSTTHRPSGPDKAGDGASADRKPGTASSYWTDERRREASPAQMPEPRE